MLKPRDPPYRGSQVAPERTKSEIEKMLFTAGAEAVQITSTANGDVEVQFILETEVQGIRKKFAVRLRTPEIFRDRNRGGRIHERDRTAEMRMLHWYLKSLLEAAQFGLMAAEEIFFSHILFKLSDGSTATASEMAAQALIGGSPAMLPGVNQE